jgi:hypothetical protein
MKTPRFNYDRDPGATSRPGARKHPKWIRMPDIGGKFPRHSTGPQRRKIYAIVAPPMPADLDGKTIRRILIFDNHPDSLRLVFGRRLNADVYPSAPRTTSRGYIILGLIPILAVVLTTVWLLL